MEKHILKENIKVKGFKKKEWTQSETNKKQNRRERERETLHVLFVVCIRHSLTDTCSVYDGFHYFFTDNQYHVGFVDSLVNSWILLLIVIHHYMY